MGMSIDFDIHFCLFFKNVLIKYSFRNGAQHGGGKGVLLEHVDMFLLESRSKKPDNTMMVVITPTKSTVCIKDTFCNFINTTVNINFGSSSSTALQAPIFDLFHSLLPLLLSSSWIHLTNVPYSSYILRSTRMVRYRMRP